MRFNPSIRITYCSFAEMSFPASLRRAAAGAAVAAPPPATSGCVRACSQLLHPVITTIPSLSGWQPLLGPALGRLPHAASCHRSMPAARYATLSDRAAITPAIEAQLERMVQRHADLLQQLSGNAMSRWAPCCGFLCYSQPAPRQTSLLALPPTLRVLSPCAPLARLSPSEMARLNKELSDLEPVVEATQQLRAKRTEVSRGEP